MYEESEGSRKTMGDVDVVYHDGLYHLFHLVLPNHDFIAHAVSEDGLVWSRVENSLFIGHPGAWDDNMLWTVHVSPDPYNPGRWRMFYTGIAQHDRGLVQRVGLATSRDLYGWEKAPVSWISRCERCRLINLPASNHTALYDETSNFPLEASAPSYESTLEEGRRWVSWRDPFYYRQGDRGWLLVAGRVPYGPTVRRGCVALLEEVGENKFEARPSLFHPGLYDDVEVPNLLNIEGQHYLVGSIREDAKIRYWYTDEIGKPWANYFDNVLLPKGNYAGRICWDERGPLIWNFYTHDITQRTVKNLVPPPKRIRRASNGQLHVVSFEGFDQRIKCDADDQELFNVQRMVETNDGTADVHQESRTVRLACDAGFQAFLLGPEADSFRFSARLTIRGTGKCGIVFRIDPDSHDGYYLSLDLYKGVAQLRAWGTDKAASGEHMMRFSTLQAGYWHSDDPTETDFSLLAYGSYIELCVNRQIIISLADQTYNFGRVGIYVESARLDVEHVRLELLHSPSQSDEHLAQG